jgi:hypothetical protein
MGGRRFLASVVVGAVGLLVVAPVAQASFHLIKVREVYPGTSNDSYVELQMYEAGQRFLEGHSLTLYDSTGALAHTSTFSSSVPNGANQATVLIGDTNTQATFGVAPDLVDAGLNVSAAGGAACWNAGGIPADCVAWGNFSGGAALQAATGTTVGTPVSAAGITAGKAIQRTIAPGCPTFLEAGDDSNDSATDFSEVTPNPRNNASPVIETACMTATTTIDTKPPLSTNSTSASFTYHATPATGATFECKLDSGAFEGCLGTGMSYSGLSEGSHTFQVKAVNGSGTGPAASYTWTVDLTPPTATIDSHPKDPSPGASAAFTYHSSETGSTFQCSLALGVAADSFSPCASSGKTYTSLANGTYKFKVRATDPAGNQGLPAEFTWEVDNSIVDTTPPQTTILSMPPDPSSSSSASFTYESNEPGSTFECALDGGTFVSCPASGISYSGLANGAHSFQVRAIDPSNNVDPTPAGYSFSVVLTAPPPVPPAPTPPSPTVSPDTRIGKKPPAKTTDRTPTFKFTSSQPGSSFQCSVDGKAYKRCRSPFTTKSLSLGRHTVRIRAIAGGLTDPSPAAFSFKVVRR